MTARRGVILFVMAGIVHNALRLIATSAGVPSGIFNYVPPYHWQSTPAANNTPTTVVLAIILLSLTAATVNLWRMPQADSSKPVWTSALGAAVMSVPFGAFAVLVSTNADIKYGWPLFVLVPVVSGFLAALVLA